MLWERNKFLWNVYVVVDSVGISCNEPVTLNAHWMFFFFFFSIGQICRNKRDFQQYYLWASRGKRVEYGERKQVHFEGFVAVGVDIGFIEVIGLFDWLDWPFSTTKVTVDFRDCGMQPLVLVLMISHLSLSLSVSLCRFLLFVNMFFVILSLSLS